VEAEVGSGRYHPPGVGKAKSLGLAVIQNAKARQHSRLTWIREGYSNTKAVSDSRKCKEKENVH